MILIGERQVSKTYLLQEFGREEYEKVAFFSLEQRQDWLVNIPLYACLMIAKKLTTDPS